MSDGDVCLFSLHLSWAPASGFAPTNADVVSLDLAHTGWRGRRSRPAASDDQGVLFEFAPTRWASGRKVLFSTLSHYELASIRVAVPVLAEEVGRAASGVGTTPKLDVKLIVATVAAVAIAIEVALALFIQLSCRIASRHGWGG